MRLHEHWLTSKAVESIRSSHVHASLLLSTMPKTFNFQLNQLIKLSILVITASQNQSRTAITCMENSRYTLTLSTWSYGISRGVSLDTIII